MPSPAAAAAAPHADAIVRRETIANTIATIVIAILLTWLLFRGQSLIDPLAEPPGGIFGIVPGTFNFTLLVTIVLTLVIRARVRRTQAPRSATGEAPRAALRLPRNLVLRALLLALLMTLALVPLSAGVVYLGIAGGWLPGTWTLAGMILYFVLHFAVLSLLATPVIVRRALAD